MCPTAVEVLHSAVCVVVGVITRDHGAVLMPVLQLMEQSKSSHKMILMKKLQSSALELTDSFRITVQLSLQ